MRKNIIYALAMFLFLSVSALRSQEIPTLAVNYFDNNSGSADYDWLKKGLADMLITDINASGQFVVVEREKLQELLKELRLSESGLIDEAKRQELGKMAGAQIMVLGSFTIAGGKMRIDARLTKVETGELIKADSVSGAPDSVFDSEKELAIKILEGAGKPISQTVKNQVAASPSSSTSMQAARTYYEGIDLIDLGKIQEAQDKFKQAMAIDPLYVKANMSLEESYKFLKDFKKNREQREIREKIAEIAALENRLKDDPWITYGDLVTKFYKDNPTVTPEQTAAFNESIGKVYMNCDTPGYCAMNIINDLSSVANLYATNMQDEAQRDVYQFQCARRGEEYYNKYQQDKGAPELLYVTTYCYKWVGKNTGDKPAWEKVKALCEKMFEKYPDYRMIEFIEDMYQEALDALGQ